MANTGAALRKDPQVPSVRLHLRVWLSALLTLVLALLAWWQARQWYQTRLVEDQRAQVGRRLTPYGNSLSGIVTRRLARLNPLTAAVAPGSLGLAIMRERAAGIGATPHVESRPAAGPVVRVAWQATPAQQRYGGMA